MASNWRRLKSLRRSTININSDDQVYCCVADVLRGLLDTFGWVACVILAIQCASVLCSCFRGRGSKSESSCRIDYGARCFPTPRLVRNRPRNVNVKAH